MQMRLDIIYGRSLKKKSIRHMHNERTKANKNEIFFALRYKYEQKEKNKIVQENNLKFLIIIIC
jgi:hypothetical protein